MPAKSFLRQHYRTLIIVSLLLADVFSIVVGFYSAFWLRKLVPLPDPAQGVSRFLDFFPLLLVQTFSIITAFFFAAFGDENWFAHRWIQSGSREARNHFGERPSILAAGKRASCARASHPAGGAMPALDQFRPRFRHAARHCFRISGQRLETIFQPASAGVLAAPELEARPFGNRVGGKYLLRVNKSICRFDCLAHA